MLTFIIPSTFNNSFLGENIDSKTIVDAALKTFEKSFQWGYSDICETTLSIDETIEVNGKKYELFCDVEIQAETGKSGTKLNRLYLNNPMLYDLDGFLVRSSFQIKEAEKELFNKIGNDLKTR